MSQKKKFGEQQLLRANDTLKTIPYYSSDPGAQAAVMEFLAKICPHEKALVWLVDTLAEKCRAWPGLGEVRGLLCTRYIAADGVDATCSIEGYRPIDYEAREIERSEALKQGSYIVAESAELVRQIGGGKIMLAIAKRRPN